MSDMLNMSNIIIERRNEIKTISKNERNGLDCACDTLKKVHDCMPETNTIKHYCAFVRHGRSKGQREIHCYRAKYRNKTIQFFNPSCRNRCFKKIGKKKLKKPLDLAVIRFKYNNICNSAPYLNCCNELKKILKFENYIFQMIKV